MKAVYTERKKNVEQKKRHSLTDWVDMSGTSSSRFEINNDTEIMKCAHELVWLFFFLDQIYRTNVIIHVHFYTLISLCTCTLYRHILILIHSIHYNTIHTCIQNCVLKIKMCTPYTTHCNGIDVQCKWYAHGKAHRVKTRESTKHEQVYKRVNAFTCTHEYRKRILCE